ncbi:MAG: nucleoside hydrolase [Clostridia bacterium]|nr:nucleoside hydrolase [Clostridia bacterium]
MEKLELIFDTDAGSDCDDMMALAYLIYAQKYLNVEIKAVTHCLRAPEGVPALRSFFRYFGEALPPMGRMVGGADLEDFYCKSVADSFAAESDYEDIPTAVSVLRRALVSCRDKCVICAVGQFTNLAALMESPADEISPLDGISLLHEKCAKLVVMAGKFQEDELGVRDADWNIKWDVPSAKKMFADCPVPIVMLPSETGTDMITGKREMELYGESTPLTKAFFQFPWAKDGRHSWDPATAVYAVEGKKEFLKESAPGNLVITNTGVTYFEPDPRGNITLLSMNCAGKSEQKAKDAMADYIDGCALKILSEAAWH